MSAEAEYRRHMERYSRETGSMSFTVVGHPSFQALLAMGKSILPFLIADLRVYGTSSVPENLRKFDVWAAFHLLHLIMGEEAPKIRDKDSGKLEPIRKTWLRWAYERGY